MLILLPLLLLLLFSISAWVFFRISGGVQNVSGPPRPFFFFLKFLSIYRRPAHRLNTACRYSRLDIDWRLELDKMYRAHHCSI